MEIIMYVLSAQAGEIIFDADGVKVTVFSIKNDQVSLKIEVPEGMTVSRSEILDNLRSRQNQK
jgi:carbon storage regulator CsrA